MNSTQPKNKELERHYLNRFLSLTEQDLPVTESERPDFLSCIGGAVVGVEVTRLFKDEADRGSPMKRDERVRSQFLQRLARQYYDAGGEPIRVQAIVRHCTADDLIATLIMRLREIRRSLSSWARGQFRIGASGEESVFFVTALPDARPRYSQWDCVNDSTGWVRPLTRQLLASRIEAKAQKLPEYQKQADRVLLLIVADRIKNSGMLDFTPELGCLDSCGFSEVHLLLHPLATHRVA